MFVKPANLGSSVGISKAHNCAELKAALRAGRPVRPQDHRGARHRRAANSNAPCSATTIPKASVPCEILPSREFYDYEDKYLLNQAQHRSSRRICRRSRPRKCGGWRWNAIRRWNAKAWRASISCCEAATGKLYINEINTIPGFTSISMYPKMWEHSGFPIPKLIDRLIELALERHAAKSACVIAEVDDFPSVCFFSRLPNPRRIWTARSRASPKSCHHADAKAADPVNTGARVLSGRHSGHAASARPALHLLRSPAVRAAQGNGKSERKGFGTVVSVLPGRVIVLQAMAGTPSAKAGLQPGDEIVAVNKICAGAAGIRADHRIAQRSAPAAGPTDRAPSR